MKLIYISLPECSSGTCGKLLLQEHLLASVSDYLKAVAALCEANTKDTADELEVLAVRLKAMSKAEYVVFPDGYDFVRESRMEHMAAREYGKKILIENIETGEIQEEY